MAILSNVRRPSRTRARRSRQLELPLPRPRGGARRGAGRKPKGVRAEVRHASRPYLDARHPVHVTMTLVRRVHFLRNSRTYGIVRGALCDARERFGVRIIHFSIQSDHIHLVLEARSRIALGRAMKGLAVRFARRLNKAAGRRGRVFADRYHARYLRSPREVRQALVYVIQNGKKHCHRSERERRASRAWLDPFSSAAYFDGWKQSCQRFVPRRDAPAHPLHRQEPEMPVVPPTVWLLRVGWRRAGGPLDTAERPTAAADDSFHHK
jgi:REP element-mobilizing transposase RayT